MEMITAMERGKPIVGVKCFDQHGNCSRTDEHGVLVNRVIQCPGDRGYVLCPPGV